MTLVTSFEEMFSWKKARELNKIIYEKTSKPEFQRDFELKNQIRSSSLSTMSNIAEGFERDNLKEFRYFMRIAKGSNGETRSQIYTAFDVGYLDEEVFKNCIKLTTDIGNLIGAFIESLNKKIAKAETQSALKNQNNSDTTLVTRHS